MSGHRLDPTTQVLFHSLIPLPSVSDSNLGVDKLFTLPVTSECGLLNHNGDESDLSPLSSSDEEAEDIHSTQRPIKGGRTLRPRDAKASMSTAESAPSGPEAISLPRSSSPVDQSSPVPKKRKRNESSMDETPTAIRGPKPKPGSYASKERCHQCRNLPRHAYMRCTSNNDSTANPCRKLFCASCVLKRYPDDIDFNPRLKKWRCPYCRGICNCTHCCSKRGSKYTSTSNLKIDPDTLLYCASLMPGNSKPSKLPSHPPMSSESANKNQKLAKKKLAKKSDRKPAKTKPSAGKVKKEPARDVESIARGLADTAAMFENFGCASGEYWGAVFSNVDGGKIGVAYVGDQLPDILVLEDDDEDDCPPDEPPTPPTKRLRASPGDSS